MVQGQTDLAQGSTNARPDARHDRGQTHPTTPPSAVGPPGGGWGCSFGVRNLTQRSQLPVADCPITHGLIQADHQLPLLDGQLRGPNG